MTSAIGMSRTLKFCLRIRYSSRSSGPSNASRKTSSASGGMYRSVGSLKSGSPYRCANATPSMVSGVESVAGAASAASASLRLSRDAARCASSALTLTFRSSGSRRKTSVRRARSFCSARSSRSIGCLSHSSARPRRCSSSSDGFCCFQLIEELGDVRLVHDSTSVGSERLTAAPAGASGSQSLP